MNVLKMELTDLNIDCLERILLHLNLSDLLNSADTCQYFRKVSKMVFARKFRNIKKVNLQCFLISNARRLLGHKHEVWPMDVQTSLQFLRCFGHLMSECEFDYLRSCTRSPCYYADVNQRIIAYLNEYCSESMVSITFSECPKGSLNHMTKPFSKVQNVSVLNCHLEPDWLVNIFPQMHSLIFRDHKNTKIDLTCITHPFPHLTHFEFGISDDRSADFCKDHITAALHLNPQLKSFNVILLESTILTPNFFQAINFSLQQLESLKIGWEFKDIINYSGAPMHFSQIKKFHFCLRFSKLEGLPRIPFSFDQLEDFAVSVVQVNDNFYDFVSKHPTIKKLKITPLWALNTIDDTKLTKALPSLTHLDLMYYELSVDEVLGFVKKFKFMEMFCFHSKDEKYDDLKRQLGDRWTVTVGDESFVKMTRLI